MSRVLLTGGAGFIGGVVARQLRERGDTVVAVVRDPSRATGLATIGCELVTGDLGSVDALAVAMDGSTAGGPVDAVIHAAGQYRLGVTAAERPAMFDANEGTTRRVLEAAAQVGVARVVYVSTCNVYGDTRGQIVDETYRRDLSRGFLSAYDESKYRAHVAAEEAIAAGRPVVIVLPNQVYGPGDHSEFGAQMAAAAKGTLPYRAFDSAGVGLVHVEDLAGGIIAALDLGRAGEAYNLSGPILRVRSAVELAAKVGDRRAPRLVVPTAMLRLVAKLPDAVAVKLGSPPNLADVISASEGVTYFASSAKAERELGFRPRPVGEGFAQVYGGAG